MSMADDPLAREFASLDEALRLHADPDLLRSCWQFLSNLFLFVAGWWATYELVPYSYALAIVVAVPTAGMMVRLFIIQHDCGHGSFFRSRRWNTAAGSLISVLTLTPYIAWKRQHAIHHATSGNLDRRGLGAISTLTVDEYQGLSWQRKLGYRIYRNPVVMFGIGAVLYFAVIQRAPSTLPRSWRSERRNILATNVVIAVVYATVAFLLGWRRVLLVQVPITWIASTAGVWLFFVQHQFENASWARDAQWDYRTASLAGSSYYKLGPLLQWFTGNIGLHHVHHLNSRVPNYRLEHCLDHPLLKLAPQLGLMESLSCARLALWDEQRRTLIPFRDLHRT